MPRYGMVIDLDRCIGCRACLEACKVENKTPEGVFWMHVFRFEQETYPNTKVWFMPRPCMHCDNAPCVKVCPVGARYKREDGIVSTDWHRCIGCRYCEVACPYGVNYFNWQAPSDGYYRDDWVYPEESTDNNQPMPPWDNPRLDERYGEEDRYTAGGGREKGVIEKCTFCTHRVENNLVPACVDVCPQYALHFGDLDDDNSIVSRILAQKSAFRLLEDAGAQPRVHYIGGRVPGGDVRSIDEMKARI
jgi:dimethyl sulfoxide reductase iron-sulfur subunit